MKIGEVSRLYNISKDTVYYYIDMGLLFPHKEGTQYKFNEQDLQSLEKINYYKKMGFSLKEIIHIFSLKRWSNWVESSTINQYLSILREKNDEINEQILELENASSEIEEEIKKTNLRTTNNITKIGLPISSLEYLVCPECNKSMDIINGNISGKYIYNGNLICECGCHMSIVDGIVVTGNVYKGGHDFPDMKRELYEKLPDKFYRCMNISANDILSYMEKLNLKNSIILETYVNGYCFLYNHFDKLDNSCTYILIDKYEEILRYYKEYIELLGLNLNIVFIADASLNYPIKKNIVDLMISFFSGNEHQLYHKELFGDHIAKYCALNSSIVGTYMSYKDYAQSRKLLGEKYPECSEVLYSSKEFYRNLKNVGFNVKHEEIGDIMSTSDKFSFACHVSGEPLNISVFYGKHER